MKDTLKSHNKNNQDSDCISNDVDENQSNYILLSSKSINLNIWKNILDRFDAKDVELMEKAIFEDYRKD